MPSFKRKRYFIKPRFQIRYAAVVSGFILLSAIISSVMTYLAIFPYLSQKLANVYPQGRLITVLKNANVKALLSTLVVIPFAAWFSMFLSHRIAGPWYRLETTLHEMAKGDFSHDVKLRPGDELKSLADAINAVIKGVNLSNKQSLDYANSLYETLHILEEETKKESIDSMKLNLLVSKLQEIARDLKASFEAETA